MIDDFAAIAGRPVSRETVGRLERFADLLIAEQPKQNLIAQSTIGQLWQRHILDSVQLLPLAPAAAKGWIDIGSGAGLPGIVIACFGLPVTLVEPRRLRAEFLIEAARSLELDATVVRAKAERASGVFDVITARAVATLDRLLAMTLHLSHPGTTWILPKGQNAKSELVQACRNWQCDAREVPSVTSADSTILVISNVRARRST